MWQTLLRGMPAVHAWIVLMSLASTTAYRPNITKLAPQTMETKRLKETYGRVYEALKLQGLQEGIGAKAVPRSMLPDFERESGRVQTPPTPLHPTLERVQG